MSDKLDDFRPNSPDTLLYMIDQKDLQLEIRQYQGEYYLLLEHVDIPGIPGVFHLDPESTAALIEALMDIQNRFEESAEES